MPPAGDGWPFLAVASSNAMLLGNPWARGGPGYPAFLFPLALPWHFASFPAGAGLSKDAGRRGRRPLQSAAGNPVNGRTHRFVPTAAQRSTCRPIHHPVGADAHIRPFPGPHLPPNKAQANLERQAFRHPPRNFHPTDTRGGRAKRMPKSGASRQKTPLSSSEPIRKTPVLSKPTRTCRFCAKRSFLLDRARPVFFSARPKRKWGAHCCQQPGIPRPNRTASPHTSQRFS